MSLKRQQPILAAFSMASMTDVIFLLLIFFMVTSTFVFPTALEVNLPDSSRQTAIKPGIRVYVDARNDIYGSVADAEPLRLEDTDALLVFLQGAAAESADGEYIAVYADSDVTYGRLVEVLDVGAKANMKMVLATKPAPATARPEVGE